MPVTWFPEHRGKVIGFVMASHGLAQTVFSPLQTLVVNPANVSPVSVREEIIANIELVENTIKKCPHRLKSDHRELRNSKVKFMWWWWWWWWWWYE